jgi:hypothetical protein
MHLLPPPGASNCEQRIDFVTDHADWQFTADFVVLGEPLILGDHKTTSGPQWAKDVADLIVDPQANLYAHALMDRHGLDRVVARWVYYLTVDRPTKPPAEDDRALAKWDAWVAAGRPKAWAVEVEIARAGARKILDKLEARALQIYEIRAIDPEPQDVPGNRAACGAFGGCPHQGIRCTLEIEDVFSEEDQDMNGKLSDFLRSRGVTTTGQATPPAPPPAPPATAGAWQPGDPLNEDQTYFAAKGKSLKYVATLADNAPTTIEIENWPDGELAYSDAIAARQAPPPAPPPPAPERGTINPPEAPAVAAATPEQAAELQGVTPPPAPVPAAPTGERDALKREAMSLGLVDGSSRLGAESLAKLVAEHKAQAVTVTAPGATFAGDAVFSNPSTIMGYAVEASTPIPGADDHTVQIELSPNAAEALHALGVLARYFRVC